MVGAAVGALLGGIGSGMATAAGVGIGDEFVREVEAMMEARELGAVRAGR